MAMSTVVNGHRRRQPQLLRRTGALSTLQCCALIRVAAEWRVVRGPSFSTARAGTADTACTAQSAGVSRIRTCAGEPSWFKTELADVAELRSLTPPFRRFENRKIGMCDSSSPATFIQDLGHYLTHTATACAQACIAFNANAAANNSGYLCNTAEFHALYSITMPQPLPLMTPRQQQRLERTIAGIAGSKSCKTSAARNRRNTASSCRMQTCW